MDSLRPADLFPGRSWSFRVQIWCQNPTHGSYLYALYNTKQWDHDQIGTLSPAADGRICSFPRRHWTLFQVQLELNYGLLGRNTSYWGSCYWYNHAGNFANNSDPLTESDVAVGTATWSFMRGFGTIWGAAIPLAIFNSKANFLVAARLQDNETASALLANGGAYTLAAGGSVCSTLGLDDNPSLEATVKGIYVDSLKLCWQVGLTFALLGFLLTFLTKGLSMRAELDTELGLANESEKKSDGETGEQPTSISTT